MGCEIDCARTRRFTIAIQTKSTAARPWYKNVAKGKLGKAAKSIEQSHQRRQKKALRKAAQGNLRPMGNPVNWLETPRDVLRRQGVEPNPGPKRNGQKKKTTGKRARARAVPRVKRSPQAVLYNRRSKPSTVMERKMLADGDIRIHHKQLLQNIVANVGVDPFKANMVRYPLQPGLLATYPYLATQAQGFQEYRIESWRMIYEPVAALTISGNVVGAYDYKPTDPEPENEVVFNNYLGYKSNPILQECSWPLNIKKILLPRHFLRQGPIGGDLAEFDCGNFYCTLIDSNVGVGVVVGKLFAEYTIVFRVPQVANGISIPISSSVTTLTCVADKVIGVAGIGYIPMVFQQNPFQMLFDLTAPANSTLLLPFGRYRVDVILNHTVAVSAAFHMTLSFVLTPLGQPANITTMKHYMPQGGSSQTCTTTVVIFSPDRANASELYVDISNGYAAALTLLQAGTSIHITPM